MREGTQKHSIRCLFYSLLLLQSKSFTISLAPYTIKIEIKNEHITTERLIFNINGNEKIYFSN